MKAPAREISERYVALFGQPRVDTAENLQHYLRWCDCLVSGCLIIVARSSAPARITVVHPVPASSLSVSAH